MDFRSMASVITGKMSIWDAEESALYLLQAEGMERAEKRKWTAARREALIRWGIEKMANSLGLGPVDLDLVARISKGFPGMLGKKKEQS